jgi:hypothetical protein
MTSITPKDDDLINISNEEIISLAALKRKIDLDNAVSSSDMDAFKKGLDRFGDAGIPMLMVAAKLLEGKGYQITTDNPETISRCRSLADHMGASIDVIRKDSWLTQMNFRPPSRQ